MKFEFEVKIPVKELENLRNKLVSMGARKLGIFKQVDLYFQHPCRDFKLTDEVLRVRMQNGRTLLTYKGPRMKGKSKSRLEIQVEVSDQNKIISILKSLGFKLSYELRKVRELWEIGEVKIGLDTVDRLGNYVELEVISNDINEANRKIDEIISKLGLDAGKVTAKTYVELIFEKMGKRKSAT